MIVVLQEWTESHSVTERREIWDIPTYYSVFIISVAVYTIADAVYTIGIAD